MEPSDMLAQGLDRLQQGGVEKNLMEGHVQKMKKGFFSKWQKTYMILTRTELRLYKGSSIRRSRDVDEKVELPKGAKFSSFPLRDMMVKDSPTKMKKLEFVFDIFAANAKRLVIAAPSDFLKKQWMIKITAAVNDFRGPTDSERKRTQAEVDKELLRLAEHIRGQQAQQRARAVPIHMAQGLKQPIDAPNDLISTEERKASLYRTASAFPVSSFRVDKKGPPPPIPGGGRTQQQPQPAAQQKSPRAAATPAQAIPKRPSGGVPCFSGVVDSRRGSFDDSHSRLSSSYGANTITASGAKSPPPPTPPKSPGKGRGADQSTQLARHSISMRSVRELGALPPPPIPPLPSRPTAPANAPPARPPPRIPPPQLQQRKAAAAASASTTTAAAAPQGVETNAPRAPVCFSAPLPTVGEARPPLPPRPKNSIGGRKEGSEPTLTKVGSPAVPPRVPKVAIGSAAAAPEPSPRGRVHTAPESEAPKPTGLTLNAAKGGSGGSPDGAGGAKLFSPRIRISSSRDDDAPTFERPHGREAAEDTPLTKREPLSSPTVRPLFTPSQPLAPLVPPPRAERPSPPAPGLVSSRSHGSRIEKASVVHRQPKHFLPAPVPRPNQYDDGEITDGNEPPSRPPRPVRSKTGLV